MTEPRTSPYLWVTHLSKILAGEQPCEWSAWFQAHYRDFDTMATSGNLALWTIEHTAQVKKRAEALTAAGFEVTFEDENHGTYQSKTGLAIGYKPDLIARCGCGVHAKNERIVEVKTGKPRNSDTVQLLLYMLMTGIGEGELYYSKTGQSVPLSKEAADETLIINLSQMLARIVATKPALKVPGANCRFCKITKADCPERVK